MAYYKSDNIKIDNSTIKYDSNGQLIAVSSGGEIIPNTIQVEVLPSASINEENNIYQYIGTTTELYTNGYFYKCIKQNNLYTWISIDTQDVSGITNSYQTTDTAELNLADDDKIPFYDVSASAKRSSTWSNIIAKLKSYFDTLYTLPTASTGTLGGIKIDGTSITIDQNGVASSVLPMASTNTLGGIKVDGTTITINSNGVASASGGGGGGGFNEIYEENYINLGRMQNSTKGLKSVTLGSGLTASGTDTVAENYYTKATGDYSHAEGYWTSADSTCSHAEGYYTYANNSETWGAAHAEGHTTSALAQAAHSEGRETKALGDASHAEGRFTTAEGNYSHAEGYSTCATATHAHAEGWSSRAIGSNSHAEGYSTSSIGSQSHAEGSNTYANDINTHAEGNSTTAIGSNAHAEGNQSIANGSATHAEGDCTTALYSASHSEGYQTYAVDGGHSEGYSASAIGAHAEGTGTYAVNFSHAEGSCTSAIENYSHAEGKETLTSEEAAHAEGYRTIASQVYSHAEGMMTTANAICSHVEGYGTSSAYPAQHIMGIHNDNKSDTLFEIGKGDVADGEEILEDTYTNIFEVYDNGAISQDNGTTKFKFTRYNNQDGYYDGSNTFHAFGSGGGTYVLPTASASSLGGIKVGSGLSIDSSTGVLSVTGGGGGTGSSFTITQLISSDITTTGAITLSDGISNFDEIEVIVSYISTGSKYVDTIDVNTLKTYLHSNYVTNVAPHWLIDSWRESYVRITYDSVNDSLYLEDRASANITAINGIKFSGGGNGGLNYSTSEQNTGLKWIDNKSIYFKVIQSSLVSTTQKITTDGIYDKVIKYYGTASASYSSPATDVAIPSAQNASINSCYVNAEDHEIYVVGGSIGTFDIVVYYTKVSSSSV